MPFISTMSRGLSPRGRGKLMAIVALLAAVWSIPAWAGETYLMLGVELALAVYPRVGGGNYVRSTLGVSSVGLSPRGRGKRQSQASPSRPTRSIPAWAGETSWIRRNLAAYRVYPRVGGGNLFEFGNRRRRNGLSPRGRGKPLQSVRQPRPRGSIPAWAGETIAMPCSGSVMSVYPRVGGGNPSWVNNNLCGLSVNGMMVSGALLDIRRLRPLCF